MNSKTNEFRNEFPSLRGHGEKETIKQLREKIVLNTATTDDYENYFQRLIEKDQITAGEVTKLFTDHGFSSIQSYVEQKQVFIATPRPDKPTEDYWTQRERFKGFIETRILAPSREPEPPFGQQSKVLKRDLRF